MRRQNIQLLALARQGDALARIEVGRRYLLGAEGFPRHIQTGTDYLTHDSLRHNAQAAKVMAECLPLEDIARLDLSEVLARGASTGSVVASVKLAVWLWARHGREADATRHLEAAAGAGHLASKRALAALKTNATPQAALLVMLRALAKGDELNAHEVAVLAARHALADAQLDRLISALHAAFALADGDTAELAELVSHAAQLAESKNRSLRPLSVEQVEASLDQRATQGDAWAALALGRALSGIESGLPASSFVTGTNVRRGAALLLRAADSGREEAWLHLYRLHADHRLSVANPQMARFCLEKAAALGNGQAQCKLGALMLRSASNLAESEQAISWLHQASAQGDEHALDLLASLHLPLQGSDSDARAAIDQVRRDYPWLAMRMQLSRDFGLTKLEALCVDPAAGLRPWGLVVGKNPFVVQSRLSAPRAVPALTDTALDNLRRTALLFSESGRDGYLLEGDARRRSLVQRRAFERHGIDESMFFAKASANTLNTLRQGSKWAFRAKAQIQLALAA